VSKKAWIIFAAVCVAVLGGLVVLSNKDRIDVSGADASKIQTANKSSGDIADHVFGKADSKVVLIEYGDFQCPGCGSAHPKVKAVVEKYKNQVAFVFRNFPLVSIHPNARAAAAAAEAAGLQGKYWEMHDKLYESQQSWNTANATDRVAIFAGYAADLGLDANVFKTDIASNQVNQKISYDQAIGKKVDITGTPTFFLNGKTIDQETWVDQQKLDDAFAAELKAQGVSLPAEN